MTLEDLDEDTPAPFSAHAVNALVLAWTGRLTEAESDTDGSSGSKRRAWRRLRVAVARSFTPPWSTSDWAAMTMPRAPPRTS